MASVVEFIMIGCHNREHGSVYCMKSLYLTAYKTYGCIRRTPIQQGKIKK